MAEQNDQTLSFSERCGQFLTQNRKPIVIILGTICAVVAHYTCSKKSFYRNGDNDLRMDGFTK